MVVFRSAVSLGLIVILCGSCKEEKTSRGPIVLGDSSMIVTETNPEYLTDYVEDLQLRTRVNDTLIVDTTSSYTAPAESTANLETSPVDDGLHIPFKEITVFIPDIKVRTFKEQDPAKSYSMSYMLTEGRLKGNHLRISGATIKSVSQRYQTSIVARNSYGTLILESLNHLTDWTNLSGDGTTYNITGLDATKLKHNNPTPATLKRAVSRAARLARIRRQRTAQWERAVRNVRSVNQKPFDVELRAVMWRIQGTDDQGKAFEKQVRMDLPIR